MPVTSNVGLGSSTSARAEKLKPSRKLDNWVAGKIKIGSENNLFEDSQSSCSSITINSDVEIDKYERYMTLKKDERDKLNRLAELEKVEWFSEQRILTSGSGFGGFQDYDSPISDIYAVTISDCHFAVLKKEDYSKALKKIEQQHFDEKKEFFRSIPCLSSVSSMLLTKLVRLFNKERFIRNQVVYN